MADIFLSYAEEDREIAGAVARLLESGGWSVWWDRKIPAGRSWRGVIESALREMRCMVVLWSKNSIASNWVNEEAEEARGLDKLLPVLIENVNPPIGFRLIQAIDMSDWDGSMEAPSARRLIDDLASFLNSAKAHPTPAIAAAPEQSGPGVSAGDPFDAARVQRAHEADSARKFAIRPRRAAWLMASVAVVAVLFGVWLWKDDDTAPYPPVEIFEAAKQPADSKEKPPNKLANDGPSAPIAASRPAVEPSPVIADPVARKPAARLRPARCADILQRAQLGEHLAAEDQAFLQKDCKR
ncbi:MAG: TIR domain-containing protein [Burkholderiales bacterium]|nr:TIR domain-containing protein [Burkholderiales bacterium]